MSSSASLKITEVFLSIQGEAQSVGKPTVFVRLTGCPLRCTYCDSEYAFFGGERIGIDDLVEQVNNYGVEHVCVTGGEPLAQADVRQLMIALCDNGKSVSLETSGAMALTDIDERVNIVMDLKAPSSGEVGRNDYDNIALLKSTDQVKFIIADRQDYDWACFKINEYALNHKVAEVLLSPSYGLIDPATLVQWIIDDRLAVRFQVQLHKVLWGDKPGT